MTGYQRSRTKRNWPEVPIFVGAGRIGTMGGRSTFIDVGGGVELYAEIGGHGPSGWIVAVHGLGEHSGRHGYLDELFGQEANVLRYDLRGHGRSGGSTKADGCFDRFKEDLEKIVSYLGSYHGMENYSLFGHSMGALIAWDYLREAHAKTPDALFLSAPPVGIPAIAAKVLAKNTKLLNLLCRFCPPIQIGGAVAIDTTLLSHDPAIRESYINDDLCRSKLYLNLLLQLILASKDAFSEIPSPPCPCFVAYGSGDRIIDTARLREYFGDTGAEVLAIEGGFHELHNETAPFREPYFDFLRRSLGRH